MQNMESPECTFSDLLSQMIKLQGQVQKNTDTIITVFKDYNLRITETESLLKCAMETLKKVECNAAVNQELIKANIHFNSVCTETDIPELPPLKMETKLKVKVENFGDALLLLGQTFDIKDKLKEIAAARYNSTPPEKKGWMIQNEQLPMVMQCLSEICDFDTSLI